MAVASTCSVASCKDHMHPTTNVIRLMERAASDYCLPWHREYRCYSFPLIKDSSGRWNISHNGSETTLKTKKSQRVDACSAIHHLSVAFKSTTGIPLLRIGIPLQRINNIDIPENSKSGTRHPRDQPCSVTCALEAGNNEKQLKTLDSYFSKLHDGMAGQLSNCIPASTSETLPHKKENKSHYEEKTGLKSLEDYFGKINSGVCMQEPPEDGHMKLMFVISC